MITSRDLEKGSTKYRIAQYASYLEHHDVRLEFVRRRDLKGASLKTLKDFDGIFNQKCLINSRITGRILEAGPRIIFDFDDAIYTRPGRPRSFITDRRVKHRLHRWLRSADYVTTANAFLAAYAQNYASSVHVIPMAIDPDLWVPGPARRGEAVVIGWAGAPVNLPNLEALEPALSAVLDNNPSARLSVFCGARPNLSCPHDYYPFRPGQEPHFVQGLDIGLLPIPDEEYSRGKSPIKAIQYLACQVPVVGNVMGATAEILNNDNSIAVKTEGEWIRALESLIHASARRKTMGRKGREFVLKHHDVKAVGPRLLQLLGS
ncbi:MAG: glycosyltransferase [bacterium]|nr:glycosyltransferase [bacterium]